MATGKTLRAEVGELRAALNELRDECAKPSSPDYAGQEPQADTDIATPSDMNAEAQKLEQVLKDLTDMGEKKIAENPVLAAGLAFFLGLLIGRLSRR